MNKKKPRQGLLLAAILGLGVLLSLPALAADPAPQTSFSLHGTPKYGTNFDHFDYADPKAPKGGDIVLSALGTFDSLNPFILKGTPTAAAGSTVDTLMTESLDEATTSYGLIAESLETPEDRSWVIFNINPKARFTDGSQVTAEDVAWTFTTLVKEGAPTYRTYYAGVDKVEVLSPTRIKFTNKPGDNREVPSILGQLPVLSKAYYTSHPFNQTTFDPPLGSGPYKIVKVDPGKSVTLELRSDYWGKDLPVNRGRFNFGTMRYDYYRDPTIAVAALKGGAFDWRFENSAKNWATEYDELPAFKGGQLVKEAIKASRLTPMQGFIFNLRKPIFADRRVREALSYAFDFEWSNRTLFYGLYKRSRSYFGNTELEAKGLPSAAELKILEPLRGKIPDEVFTKEYEPPKTDGSGNMRANLAAALKLLGEAGWTVKNNRLVDKNGTPMEFEVLLDEPSFERITLPFVENLKRLGVTAKVRTIDAAQYQHRVDDFDYDMIVNLFPATLSPGNEQREIWGTASADEKGSYNVVGVKNPAIDQLVDLVISAPNWDDLVARSRALDRVLQWSYFTIPHFNLQEYWMVYWNMFGHPKASEELHGPAFDTWWVDKDKAAKLTMRGNR